VVRWSQHHPDSPSIAIRTGVGQSSVSRRSSTPAPPYRLSFTETDELYRGESAEGGLPAAPVVVAFDPGQDRQAQILAGVPATPVQDVLLLQGKKDSMVALSPAEATRPIEPCRPAARKVVAKARERN
jgi:hypothetical protein